MAALTQVSCRPSDEPGVTDPSPSQDGPLQTDVGSGGSGLHAPKRTPWSGTYGGILLCAVDGADVVVSAIRYESQVQPTGTASYLRTVAESDGSRVRSPLIASLGEAPDLLGVDFEATSLVEAVGATIDYPCATDGGPGFVELLTTMTVGETGGWIERMTVEYTSDGVAYELPVDWTFISCGSAITDPDTCGRRSAG